MKHNTEQVREAAELIRTTLSTAGFRQLYALYMKPELDTWRRALLTNPDLEEGKRKGFVQALALFERALTGAYRDSGAPIPEWIVQEFDVNDVS